PDPDFGEGGKRQINLGDSAYGYAVAVDDDGNTVLAGDGTGGIFALRLLPGGANDPSFNGGAALQFLPSPTREADFGGMALTETGDIVLAGTLAGGAEGDQVRA